jgi:small subunit ribosomal protein S3
MAVERKFITEGVRKARVEKYLSKELKRAGYGGMDIARTPLGTQVTIFAEKPGIVIGKGGKLVHQLTQDLAQNYGVESPQIEVQQVTNPSFNAQIMSVAGTSARQVPASCAASWTPAHSAAKLSSPGN